MPVQRLLRESILVMANRLYQGHQSISSSELSHHTPAQSINDQI